MKLTLFLSLVGATLAAGQTISPHVTSPRAGKTASVIVQYRPSDPETFQAKVRSLGRSAKQVHGELGLVSVEATAQDLEALAADPNVEYVSPDHAVQSTQAVSATLANQSSIEFARRAAGTQQLLTSGFTGQSIGVAVIDSGVNDQPDLRDGGIRVVFSQTFVGGAATDAYGHGTHVAGIIAGNGAMSTGTGNTSTIAGIAPRVNIVNLKVLNDTGIGSDTSVIAGINRAIELRTRFNIRIINLSLGRPVFESFRRDPLCRAVEAAWRAGIVVVVAAGNNGRDNTFGTNGYGTIGVPGNSPFVITVGAMKTQGTISRGDDEIATYSSKGPSLIDRIVKPDLVAPGNQIVSVMAANNFLATNFPSTRVMRSSYQGNLKADSLSADYFTLSGTSMATPMVSAAAAMLLQRDSTLTPDQVKSRLMRTASKTFRTNTSFMDMATCQTFTAQYDLFTVGAGYLDVNAAMANNHKSTRMAISPYVVYDAATRRVILKYDTIAGTNVVWGENVVWGTNIVWGENVVWGENIVWGENVVWGESTTTGFNVVWGESSPNSTSVAGARNISPVSILTSGEPNSTMGSSDLPGMSRACSGPSLQQ
ncbi:MAG: S8 family peptidase [Bryobacteraceae bacterium]|nr:S8 family peptidase [Bryobacteraceae bacterium]